MDETSLKSRKVLLINPSFQIRVATYVTGLITIFSVFYPVVIIGVFDFVSGFLTPECLAGTQDSLQSSRNWLLTQVAVVQTTFLVLIFLGTLALAHRIAGPLFKLKNHLQKIKDGAPLSPVQFRRKDFFPEIAEEFNSMVTALAARDRELIAELQRIANDPRSQALRPELQKLAEKLGRMKE